MNHVNRFILRYILNYLLLYIYYVFLIFFFFTNKTWLNWVIKENIDSTKDKISRMYMVYCVRFQFNEYNVSINFHNIVDLNKRWRKHLGSYHFHILMRDCGKLKMFFWNKFKILYRIQYFATFKFSNKDGQLKKFNFFYVGLTVWAIGIWLSEVNALSLARPSHRLLDSLQTELLRVY